MVSRLVPRTLTRLGAGAIGLVVMSALGGLTAPIARAQNWSLLDCLRRAGSDAYAVARCKNPNAQAPNLEEPITPSAGSGPGGPPPTSPNPSSSAGSRPGAGPGSRPTATQPYRPGPPASSYNSANRARVTIDCLSNYSNQPSAVLDACGAWAPNRPTASPTASPMTTPTGPMATPASPMTAPAPSASPSLQPVNQPLLMPPR
ncbi:MAG TPA: hypothetical protein V6D46_07115 [Coleofasciculaceae cyanobacterium]